MRILLKISIFVVQNQKYQIDMLHCKNTIKRNELGSFFQKDTTPAMKVILNVIQFIQGMQRKGKVKIPIFSVWQINTGQKLIA